MGWNPFKVGGSTMEVRMLNTKACPIVVVSTNQRINLY